MADIHEETCPWCDGVFPPERWGEYCCEECRREALHAADSPLYGARLHDGMRLLSDDFGELAGDESATYEK